MQNSDVAEQSRDGARGGGGGDKDCSHDLACLLSQTIGCLEGEDMATRTDTEVGQQNQ